MFTHGAPKSSLGTRSKVTVRSRSNWNLEMLVFVEEGKPENPEKNPRSKDENQQQTQLTYDVESGNRTRCTLVGGECSTTAPSLLPIYTKTRLRNDCTAIKQFRQLSWSNVNVTLREMGKGEGDWQEIGNLRQVK